MKLQPVHRAKRFFRSLVARAPSQSETTWAEGHLSDPERRAFSRLSAGDRTHSIRVAKAVAAHLDGKGPPAARSTGAQSDAEGRSGSDSDGNWMVTAALLHDIGKSVPGLGTYGRVVATLCGAVAGEDMADHWVEKSGMTRRIGLYLKYPDLGVPILELAGSDPRVVAWSQQHHRPEEEWTVPVEAGRILRAADDGQL